MIRNQDEPTRAARIRAAVRRGWDLRAGEFGRQRVQRHRPKEPDLPEMPPGARVLDVGCGTGSLMRDALATGRPGLVVGVDLSRGMLRRGAPDFAAARTATLIQGDAERLPLASGAFDLAVSRRALGLTPDLAAAFAEMARVLRPGGRLSLSLFGDRSRGRSVDRFMRQALREVLGPAAEPLIGLSAAPSIGAVDAAAHAAGLEVEEVSAATAYGWDDPDALVDGLLVGIAHVRSQLAAEQVREVESRVRALARAAATPRGLPDWSYSIRYRGVKPAGRPGRR